MFLLYSFSFLAGFVTILAPCIWPVLPIVLSSSVAGGKGHSRPLGITLGVMISFSVFTLAISYLVKLFHFDPNTLRIIAVVIIVFLGLTMIIPTLSAKFEIFVNKLSNLFGQKTNTNSGFLAGLITGLSLGIVWTPCAGPILATVATLAATGKFSLSVILVTVFYVMGVGVPLFTFGYGGAHLIKNLKGLNRFTGKIQKIFGVIMILAAIAIYTNYAQTLQLQLINQFPALGTVVNGFENSSLVGNQLNKLSGKQSLPVVDTTGLFNIDTPAPDFTGITHWLNTNKPISIKDLRGKVILVDFWTYTCINCIRTLPFITGWYQKYKDDGFVVIGVHTPEFQFEHDTGNVQNAIKMFNIQYPVAQDNNYTTWNAYSNEYWPAEYLIDADGNIRRADFGEGEYDKMEKAIQALLMQAGNKVDTSLLNTQNQTPQSEISPETYLGSARMQYYFPNGSVGNGQQNFTLSDNLTQNSFSYGGTWTISDENAVASAGSTLNYNFKANHVYIILRPKAVGIQGQVKVYLDGKVITATNAGVDDGNGIINVTTDRLYDIVNIHGSSGNHILKLEFVTPGIQAYTFTFG